MRRVLAPLTAAALLAGAGALLTTPRSAAHVDKDCSDFSTQAEAQHYFTSHGGSPSNNFDRLDADHDGIACESLPCPCSKAGGGSGGNGGPSNGIPAGRRLQARVVEAVDGDTLKVRFRSDHSITDVRLIGIDTPETRRPGTPIECGGPQASKVMHRLADGRRVTLVTDPTQDRIDRYGRLLAYAIRRGGLNLNRAQVRRGWAEVYVYAGVPFKQVRSFRRAQRMARKEDRGVWRLCGGDFHTAQ